MDTQLTSEGVAQAMDAELFVAQNLVRMPNISFSSCLMRAMQTAAITFPCNTVQVADFIPEAGFDAAPRCAHGIGSCALPPREQLKYFTSGRRGQSCPSGAPTPNLTGRFDWSDLAEGGMPSDYTMAHTANWGLFLQFIWKQEGVRDLVAQMQEGAPALISVTTHGITLHEQILPPGSSWAHNAAIYKGKLPFQYDDHGKVVGFKDSKPTDVTCWHNCGPSVEEVGETIVV